MNTEDLFRSFLFGSFLSFFFFGLHFFVDVSDSTPSVHPNTVVIVEFFGLVSVYVTLNILSL